jgi:predicted ATPase/class 3 adenylate cyclase
MSRCQEESRGAFGEQEGQVSEVVGERNGRGLPSGTVTFLLTDIEGSTRNWEASPIAMRAALLRHDALLNEGIAGHSGHVLTERGEGDSFFAVFERASDAVAAVTALQLALHREPWPEGAPVKVRMAIHTGEATGDYRGQDVNRCARLRALAHGGQVVMSSPTEALVRHHLPPGVSIQDIGEHRLRDLAQPERVYQLNHDELPGEFPRLRSPGALKHNLPLQLTSFIGRQAEIENLEHQLRDHHLVTVVGAGGSGKTRLALHVAADLVERFDDGVWLIDLSPLSDWGQVERAVALPLEIKEEPGRPLEQTLLDHLGDKELLLLFDNCEHLVEAASRVAESLLRAIPRLRILATSREPLNIPGETAWRIPSLSIPDLDQIPDPDALEQYEAIRLFMDRALAVQPTFALTTDNSPPVVQVCHRLDGVPLAIELAAARMKLMGPEEILKRLEDRFQLLTGGSRTALPRQQTLRAAVDWSHDLLSEEERVLFRRLSVFVSGFDLEAAEQVCRGDALGVGDILDLLAALVDKSLVAADIEADGSFRYRLHETLRQYGHEKLIAEEEGRARDQHLAHFLDLAERAYTRAGRTDPTAAWLDRQERDHDNYRAALAWSRERHPEEFVRLAGALSSLWWLRAIHLPEGREWLADALATRQGLPAAVARALTGASLLASWGTEPTKAAVLAEESLAIWRDLGDALGEALALEALGWSQVFAGDDPAALGSMQQSLEILRVIGNERLLNRGELDVSQVLVNLGRVDEVESVAAEALARGRRLDEPRDVHFALHFLADSSLARGDPVEAQERYAESLRATLAYGNTLQAGMEVQGMAMALAGQGRLEKAFRLNAAAQAWLHEGGTHSERIPFWAGYMRRYLDPARESLSERALATLEEEGRQMGFEAAIEYALDRTRD